jgi:hypothetical protein
MSVRRRGLPLGWYPETPEQTLRAIGEMSGQITELRGLTTIPAAHAVAGVLPHAGWDFSGTLALEVLSFLVHEIDTIVIIGGHMSSNDRIVSAFDDSYDTPLGELRADIQFLEAMSLEMDIREDRERDNTVEVHLPLVRFLAPTAMVLGMRSPPSPIAMDLGKKIAKVASSLGRRVAVAGSTDLTHYGINYGFCPIAGGAEALQWVREVNDRRIIESMLALNAEQTLERALREKSACSVGGAVAAMSFAREMRISAGSLVGYMTSSEVSPGASFVGYAGILYGRGQSGGV